MHAAFSMDLSALDDMSELTNAFARAQALLSRPLSPTAMEKEAAASPKKAARKPQLDNRKRPTQPKVTSAASGKSPAGGGRSPAGGGSPKSAQKGHVSPRDSLDGAPGGFGLGAQASPLRPDDAATEGLNPLGAVEELTLMTAKLKAAGKPDLVVPKVRPKVEPRAFTDEELAAKHSRIDDLEEQLRQLNCGAGPALPTGQPLDDDRGPAEARSSSTGKPRNGRALSPTTLARKRVTAEKQRLDLEKYRDEIAHWRPTGDDERALALREKTRQRLLERQAAQKRAKADEDLQAKRAEELRAAKEAEVEEKRRAAKLRVTQRKKEISRRSPGRRTSAHSRTRRSSSSTKRRRAPRRRPRSA